MYRRFLNNNDYLGIITEEALEQLIRGNEERIEQAEEAAEASIVEYLTDNYEVEKELEIGKNLRPYNKRITYPAGSHFYNEGKIWEAVRSINGIKEPSNIEYWNELLDYDEQKFNEAKPYSQIVTYKIGDVVKFSNAYFECLEPNGVDLNDVRIPGINAWSKIETYSWEPNVSYSVWGAVKYEDSFYALLEVPLEEDEPNWATVNPFDSEHWGMIGSYDSDFEYEFSGTEYVVFDGEVYFPVISPSADSLKEDWNICRNDPRNSNIKKHLLRLAVYELHKLISPNNVSSARIADYEASIIWLRDANRCKINPQIPRKMDAEDKPVAEFAIATFMRDYDPYKNPWQI